MNSTITSLNLSSHKKDLFLAMTYNEEIIGRPMMNLSLQIPLTI